MKRYTVAPLVFPTDDVEDGSSEREDFLNRMADDGWVLHNIQRYELGENAVFEYTFERDQ